MLMAFAGCDEQPTTDNSDVAAERVGPLVETDPQSWIVAEGDAQQADNPEFSMDDAVVLDELNLPDGARAQVVELPDDAGVGIIWLGAPPQIGDALAPEYSPFELSQAFGTDAGSRTRLRENHDILAAAGRVPAQARDLLLVGATTDPSHATSVINRSLCSSRAPSYWFNQWWGYYKQTCPSGTLCGSTSNDQTGATTGNFYIVALASTKTALQTCNGGEPIGTQSNDLLNAQVQYKVGSSGWHAFYTSPPYATGDGVVFTYYGFSVNRFRMRIYNASSGTGSLAAAIW